MADLSITAANVILASGGTKDSSYNAGETITAGQVVYVDSSDNDELKLCQADGTEAEAEVKGIALCGSSDGQPCVIAKAGDIDLGATLTIGETYVVSQTYGGIAPIGDLLTGDYVSILGTTTTASNLEMKIHNTAVEKP